MEIVANGRPARQSSSQVLHDDQVGEPAALAHRLKSKAATAGIERLDQGGRQLGARGSERVPISYAAIPIACPQGCRGRKGLEP